MLEIKHNVTEMKNASYGLISTLDTALERIPKTEDISVVTPENLKSKEKMEKRRIEYPRTVRKPQCNIPMMGAPEGGERNRRNI